MTSCYYPHTLVLYWDLDPFVRCVGPWLKPLICDEHVLLGRCSRADPSGALRLWDVHPGRASDDVRGTLLLAVLMARTWVMSLSALRGAHHLRNSIQTTLGLS